METAQQATSVETAQQTETAAAPAAARMTVAQRIQAVKANIESAADEPVEAAATHEAPAEEPAAAPAADESKAAPPPEKAAGRRARMEAARKKEAEQAEARRQREAARKKEAEDDRIRKEHEALKSKEERWGLLSKDPAELLKFAEDNGMSLDQVIEYIRTRTTNPAAHAAREAQKHSQTIEQRLQAKLDAVEKKLAEDDERRDRERAEAEAAHKDAQLTHDYVKLADDAAEYPLINRWKQRHTDEGLFSLTNKFIAPLFRETGVSGAKDLADATEEFLTVIVRTFVDPSQQKTAQQTNSPKTAQQTGTSQSPRTSGTPRPATMSQDVASERRTVTEKTSRNRLPLKERIRLAVEESDDQW